MWLAQVAGHGGNTRLTYISEKLDCTIGQLPAGLPDAAQNFMNVVPAARSFVDLDSKNYYLATGSYQALAGLHTNYSPEIVCKCLSK